VLSSDEVLLLLLMLLLGVAAFVVAFAVAVAFVPVVDVTGGVLLLLLVCRCFYVLFAPGVFFRCCCLRCQWLFACPLCAWALPSFL
jgi:hypothetical protein